MKLKRVATSLALCLALYLLWSIWNAVLLPRLTPGDGAALLDTLLVKTVIWAVPCLLLLRGRGRALAVSPLFSPFFPWLACLVLLCASTAFLHTVRLLNGLADTHVLLSPMPFAAALGAGVLEELAFRGYFFNVQSPTLGFWPAAVLNGAMFTLYHYPGLLFGQSWAQLCSPRALLIFLMGVVFCWMFQKWGNLALNMTVHTIWDVLSYLFCLS